MKVTGGGGEGSMGGGGEERVCVGEDEKGCVWGDEERGVCVWGGGSSCNVIMLLCLT